MLWKLVRYTHNNDQVVPRFAGWRIMVSDACCSPTKTMITYLLPMHKPITEYDTVVEYLHQVQEMAHQVNMPYAHLTLDVGAAAKTYHVLWNFTDEFENVIIHLGDFQENFGIMGQFVSGSGFEDIVHQAGLCASGSLKGALRGKHYNRAWSVYEHFSDALERLLLVRFLEDSPELHSIPSELLKCIRYSPKPTDLTRLLQNVNTNTFWTNYEAFRQQVRSGSLGKTAQFWIMYLDMMDRRHLLHMAIKENDFDLRLLCWTDSLPLCFAFNKHNYARYGAYYVHSLQVLDVTHPGAKQLIEKQGISVQRSHHKASRQALDQAGEQTFNRSAKSPGGIKQFANNQTTYDKWVLNRPHLAKVRNGLLQMTGLDSATDNPQKTCRPSEIIKSEQRVAAVLVALEEEFLNPFSSSIDSQRLYNLSSRAPVEQGVTESMIKSY